MRKGAVIIWLTSLFLAILCLFWRSAWIYSLPTPVPVHYVAVQQGASIEGSWTVELGDIWETSRGGSDRRPVFLHFFNPDCPCSRFNIPHFRSLVRQYGGRAKFAVVVLSGRKFTPEEIRKRFDLEEVPVLFDSSIAAACGVYSTPQAVIIDTGHRLYYRGNYNRSRYCTDEKSNYARMALEYLLLGQPATQFSPYAVKAYGCQLPVCNQN